MADATGDTTSNYTFKTLDGTDTAGYTSINSLITSIDSEVSDHFLGMIMLVSSSWTSPTTKAGTDMWRDYTTANGYTNVPSPPNAYHKYVIRV